LFKREFPIPDVGITHMASALMAIEHFNARNESVVPELSRFRDCPIKFDTEKSAIFDTQTFTHLAAETIFEQPEVPCAVAGPYHDIPALELSTLAAAAKFPVTAHRAFNQRVVTEYASPFTSQVFPDMIAYTKVIVDSLLQQNRTNYVAIVYSVSDTGSQRRESLSAVMDASLMENRAYGYNTPFVSPNFVRDIREALQAVKDSGFRTIVMCMEFPLVEIPLIAVAANALEMSNGDYLWAWFGDFDTTYLTGDEDIQKFLAGSQWIVPLEGYWQDPNNDKFLLAWKSQDTLAVDRLNAANPIKPNATGYQFAEADFFKEVFPSYGSGFLYDSVIATGMGACLALAKNGNVTVNTHVRGIRSVNFTGATGTVRFSQNANANTTQEAVSADGARETSSVNWGALNLLPPQKIGDELVPTVLTHLLIEGTWGEVEEMIYADGRNVPPDLLRKEPEQNHLDPGIRNVGFALMGIAMLTAVAAGIWVYLHRTHRILLAAQPYFLYALCFGSVISASSIFSISFDESYGWSDQQLGGACTATPWLLALGHIITYGALFSKLWRINKVLQFSRRKIEVGHVAWPSAILFAAAIAILSLWTGLDSMTWKRVETDPVTGESFAECQSEHFAAFMVPLVLIMLLPSLLTAIMAWKTKDIDDSYSESYWICIMIVVQLEVIVVSVPMIALLRDISSSIRYIGFVFIIWTFPMSALLLIFGPKVAAHYQATRGNGGQRRSKRGEVQGIRVSGLITSYPESNSSQPRQVRDPALPASSSLSHTDTVCRPQEDGSNSNEELKDET
jgi:hypothetical protein